MGELYLGLSQARIARGLTLEDAERSTRIAKKFLIALEERNYSVFPAPVYARGFLRTYSRYLGLDPEAQLAELPVGYSYTPRTTLPPVSRPITFNPSWLMAGVVTTALIIGGILFTNSGNSIGELQSQVQDAQAQRPAVPEPQSEPVVSEQEPAQSVGRTLEIPNPGELPDFAGVRINDALAYLDSQDISYLLIESPDVTQEAGIVLSQVPEAGIATEDTSQVTLTMSIGAIEPSALRTDCALLAEDNRRTAEEQAWFEENCGEPEPTPTEVVEQPVEEPAGQPVEAVPGDRTNCEEMRGTPYRSPSEREFFLANCILVP